MSATDDPRSAAIERLAAAQESLAKGFRQATAELHQVDTRRAEQLGVIARQTKLIKRQGWAQLTSTAVTLFMMLIVLSAVMPGVPLLRIHERGEATTAKAVFDLQCTTLWANGYRVEPCAKVNALLSQVAGKP